ncbi:hypothetical protein NLJ89_g1455 [Agrocybe chaxingu]|uniref:Uncharacterized protein n=1 Tax=Agrocybe chaxingu TaxID=84603 RepID=A0A9W8MZZ7_9AGAR|nr:hypothetical protein NLJ89_g1455 [Agrocybe chaxingu]
MPDFLKAHPPTLQRVFESQAFSSSSTSLSSSRSSTSYFDCLSRSSSACLTDITPPISPGEKHSNAASSMTGVVGPQHSTFEDESTSLLRSFPNLEEDLGYASDRDQDDEDFDAVEALRSRLTRNKPTIKTKRALKIMEKRGRHESSPIIDGEGVRTPLMPTLVVVTEAEAPVEDWTDDFELGQCDGQVEVRVESVESDNENQDDAGTASNNLLREQDIASPFLVDISPIIAPKQVPQSSDQEWESSSFSLYSPGLSSSASMSFSVSLSQIVLSPSQVETSSPNVFEAPGQGMTRFSSPAGISNVLFDLPTLMRLEIASSLEQQSSQLAPHPPLVGLGFDLPECERSPELLMSPLSPWILPSCPASVSSLGAPGNLSQITRCDRATSVLFEETYVTNEVDGDPIATVTSSHSVAGPLSQGEGDSFFPVSSDNSLAQAALDTIVEEPDSDRTSIIGLGLGSATERSLQSSSSISQLCQATPPTTISPYDPSGPAQSPGGLDRDTIGADNAVASSSTTRVTCNIASGVSKNVELTYALQIPPFATDSLHECLPGIEPLGVLSVQDPSTKMPNGSGMRQTRNAGNDTSDASPKVEPAGVPLEANGFVGSTSLSSNSLNRILSDFPLPPTLHHHLLPRPMNPTHSQAKQTTLANEATLLCSTNAHSEQAPSLTRDVDPRSPCPNSRNDFTVAVEPRDGLQSIDFAPPPPSLACVPFLGHEIPAPSTSDGALRSSKSADGLGIGLPSDLGSRPPRQRDVSSHGSADRPPPRMSTAESCQNLAQLASSSSPASSPSAGASSPSSPSPWNFLRIRPFSKRQLYAIPEVRTPSPNPPRRRFSPTNLLSPIINRIRSPRLYTPWYKSPLTKSPEGFGTAMPRDSGLSPLPGMSPHSAPSSPSGGSLFPKLMSHRPHSAPSLSPSQPSLTVTSPALVEHLDVPKGLEIFRRASPSTASPKTKAAASRLRPRRFQHLF